MKIVSKILFAMVVFTIVVPSDCIMLAQFSTFRSFDLFGIIKALTGSGINMTKNMASMIVLAATGMGVKSGLYIYILRQGIRGLPYSIEEAAFVDGAGFLRTFFQIVVPSASGFHSDRFRTQLFMELHRCVLQQLAQSEYLTASLQLSPAAGKYPLADR